MRRQMIEKQVHLQDYDEISRAARQNRRVLSWLLGLTYAPDDVFGWKAVWAMGQAAAAIAEDDPEFIRGILRRLQWSLNDESGGIGWRAAAAMGAILAASPGTFDEFAPIIASLLELEEEHFYPDVLWSIGLIAPQVGDRINFALSRIRELLHAEEGKTRGMAVWALLRMGDTQDLDPMRQDLSQFEFFDGCRFYRMSVADLIARAEGKL